MRRRSRHSRLAAAFVWLTAVLLLVQPGAAVHCHCRVQVEEGCASVCHDRCCQHDHGKPELRVVCAIARSTPVAAPLITSPIGCPCPENCPCRVQHAQQQLGLIRSSGSERVLKTLLLSSAAIITPREFPLLHDSKLVTVAPHTPQLKSCAMLCRFTI
ncbi:hypothetical protein [Anatilimnocola floriformis]|uniref:hypothetical protein n=1 Tax=Anatilimnocola floriformis TaxID=2948575 RepID=UPI0020C25982|nr:hypothetical protein [Anatilimnocola floriformis]